MRMERLAAGLLAVLLAVVLPLAGLFGVGPEARAENLPLIRDDADLLSAAEEESLYQQMLPLCEYGTPVFWTTNEAGDYRAKAERFYVQQLGNASGLLFVIDMNQRELTLLSDGEIYRIVTTAEANTVVDNVYRMAGRGEYAACAKEVFAEAYQLLRGEQIARPMKIVSNALLGLTLAMLIVWAYVRHHYEHRVEAGRKAAPLPVTAAAGAMFAATLSNGVKRVTRLRKTDMRSSGGHGGGGHGGGFSGGGGGFSGGGGSHRF